MATARREQARTHAVNVAQAMSIQGKVDWDHFVKTGQFNPYVRPMPPGTPVYLAALKRMRKQNAERN